MSRHGHTCMTSDGMKRMIDEVEHLTAEQHIERADKALAAAKEAHTRYIKSDRTDVRRNVELADYLDLMQMVNTHANMASAKSLVAIANRNVPVIFNGLAPGEEAKFLG